MKGAKPAPKSVKSAKGTVTKVKASGGAAGQMIEYGADTDSDTDSESEGTALHRAAVRAVARDDLSCLKIFLKAGAREVSKKALTPTQYIQKQFGGDASKVDALERAVDLLYEYSSAGKRAAKLEAKVDALKLQLDLVLSGGASS